MSPEHVKVITTTRRARFEYHVEGKVECGIALTGTEVKSLREGSAQLSDAYAIPKGSELWLLNAQIPPYKPAGPLGNHDPKRTRKLLLHRREIERLSEQQARGGYALIPLSMYFKDGRVKVEIGVCKGKTGVDKRDTIAERVPRGHKLAYLERMMVRPTLRGRMQFPSMIWHGYALLAREGVDICVITSVPGLVRHYVNMGGRPYGARLVEGASSAEVPLMI